jgi:effector-binding domain-containing protein
MMQGAPVLGAPRARDFSGQATLVVKAVARIGPQLPTAIRDALGPVYALLKARGLPIPGHNVVSYGLFLPDGSIPIECGVLTPDPIAGGGSVVPSALPAGRVAVLSHLGPYHEMSRTYDAIKAWCEANGLQQSGPAWEEYDDWSDDPATRRTDVYRLLR